MESMAASGSGSLKFTDDVVTADKSSRMDSTMYTEILFVQVWPDASQQHWMELHSADGQ